MTSGKVVDDLINTLIIKKIEKKRAFNYGQDIVMAFLPPVVGCLVKKGLQKGGGVTGTPELPWLRPCDLAVPSLNRSIIFHLSVQSMAKVLFPRK